ncbi:DUF3349 domain-containing protein [Microbacterium indicum]|uniref:DUF3349 domain-containing protein n=1 Tax=Microbacterium indicum TaxID=358100 RepID=UPI000407E4A2|nr:DUF3349 domain-containing protein [Microbacterium indicum]
MTSTDQAPFGDEQDGAAAPSGIAAVVAWLRQGYADGVPAQDYVPLLEVLHRKLTDSEVDSVTRELIASDNAPFTADDIAEATRRRVLEHPSDEDITRVAVRLVGAGWPLEGFADLES